jgi:hypothetical protein
MLKLQHVLEHKNETRLYKFSCDHDSPIGEIYDALTRMKNFVGQQIAKLEETKPGENKNV